MKPIIKVENLGKQYRIGARQARYETFRESVVSALRTPLERLLGPGRPAEETIWALEGRGLRGRAGRSGGHHRPQRGRARSRCSRSSRRSPSRPRGRSTSTAACGSLLEVGTGFHPELTGRENVYLNGAILGMKRAEIARKFDEIVAFAEVEQFLDTPVKRYSSGMYMRLAFAVAAHLEPEILIVDEVLAVGDAEFQKKCLGKMGDLGTGRAVPYSSCRITCRQYSGCAAGSSCWTTAVWRRTARRSR